MTEEDAQNWRSEQLLGCPRFTSCESIMVIREQKTHRPTTALVRMFDTGQLAGHVD